MLSVCVLYGLCVAKVRVLPLFCMLGMGIAILCIMFAVLELFLFKVYAFCHAVLGIRLTALFTAPNS